jgi:hypothetical protein
MSATLANQTRSIPINDDQRQSDQDHAIDARPVRGVIDCVRSVAFGAHALRRQFEHPGEHHRRHEADHDQDHDRARHPRRRIEHRQHRARYLHHQPRGDEIQPRHADDVATLEFFDQRHAVPGYPRHSVREAAGAAALVVCGHCGTGIPKPPRRWRSASAEARAFCPLSAAQMQRLPDVGDAEHARCLRASAGPAGDRCGRKGRRASFAPAQARLRSAIVAQLGADAAKPSRLPSPALATRRSPAAGRGESRRRRQ